MKINLNIKTKLFILLISLCSLVSIFIAVYFPLKIEEEYKYSLMDKVKTIAEITSTGIGSCLYFSDQDAIRDEMEKIEKIDEIDKIAIYNIEEKLIYDFNPELKFYTIPAEIDTILISKDEKFILSSNKISFNTANVGYLQFIYNLEPLYRNIAKIRQDIILASLVLFIINCILAYFLSLYITKPIESIAATVKEVSNGNLDIRSNVKSKDEMGILAASFNKMIEQLKSFYTNLEELVEKRTEELSQANELLNKEMEVRKNAEKILSENQERLLDAESIANLTNWEWDKEEDIIEWSPMVKVVLEYSDTNLPQSINELVGFIEESQKNDFKKLINSAWKGEEKVEKEFTLISGSGKEKTVNVILKLNEEDKNKVFGIIQDVTIFKNTEKQLMESLEVKKTLLKEIHHRVKNNLQIIGSLMFLQSNQIEDEYSKSVFDEGRDRIKSIALIHETLYATDNLSKIDMYKYSNNLSSYLKQSYKEGDKITLVNNCESIFIPVDIAVPCGLIINELITNAIKHAFADSSTGEIRLDFEQSDTFYRLAVKDNGRGFIEGIDFNKSNTLGMQLVSNLARQLKGEINLQNSAGAEVEISFPICQE